MDSVFSLETLTYLTTQYGSGALFILLALGIIAFPIPEETLMVFAGILIASGKLHMHYTIIAALGGSLCGITVSYLVGRTAGSFVTHKYGRWMGLTEERLEKAHDWFQYYGKWSLFFGYFIPGVRHFTGLIAGTTALDVRLFMIFAYTGALLWVSTFLSVGYFFGEYAFLAYDKFATIEVRADWISIGLLAVFILYVAYLVIRHFRDDIH